MGAELLNVHIDRPENEIRLTLDWYNIYWTNDMKIFSEENMEDITCTGSWEHESLIAKGAIQIHLTDFYFLDGKQYAIGYMEIPDGIPTNIAMVRP